MRVANDPVVSAMLDIALNSSPMAREEERHGVRDRIVDTLGVALAASAEPATAALVRLTARSQVPDGVRVWGAAHRTTPERAALVSGALVRALDWNDTYMSRDIVHPSDVVGSLFVAAELSGATGSDLVDAVGIAYALHVGLADSLGVRGQGGDGAVLSSPVACAVSARLLGLSRRQAEDALAVATVATGGSAQTRRGRLSAWKGIASPAAAADGLFACLLAGEGVTGPEAPFVGEHGLISGPGWRSGVADDVVAALGSVIPGDAVARTHLKPWPAAYALQAAIEAALDVRTQIEADDGTVTGNIASIDIHTYAFAAESMASPAKWAPDSRETADHSLPYTVATALLHGDVDLAAFQPERYADPAIHDFLRNVVHIHVDDGFTAAFPECLLQSVEVTTAAGNRYRSGPVSHAAGHAMRPMSPEAVDAKFTAAAASVRCPQHTRSLLGLLRSIDEAPGVGHITEAMGAPGDACCATVGEVSP